MCRPGLHLTPNVLQNRHMLDYFGEKWPDTKFCGTCDTCVLGVQPPADYFEETGTLLNAIHRTTCASGQSYPGFSKLCRDLDGECNRGASFWRGLSRQLIESGYAVDVGVPSGSQERNSVNEIACPQPTESGLEVLHAWQRCHPTADAGAGAGRANHGAVSVSDGIVVGGSSLLNPNLPLKPPRQGFQSDLASWRVLTSLSAMPAPGSGAASGATDGGVSAAACAGGSGAGRADRPAVLLRPEGDMLACYEKKSKSAWADAAKRAQMLGSKGVRCKGGGKGGGKRGRKGGGGRKGKRKVKRKGGGRGASNGARSVKGSCCAARKTPRPFAGAPKFKVKSEK
jgi:hypothetical protein